MALLFGLGGNGDKKPKKPKKNKRQDYVSNKPQTGFGKVAKPEGTKTGKATSNSTYKEESSCPSGKGKGNYCPPPTRMNVGGLPNPKGEPEKTTPPLAEEPKPKKQKEEPITVYKNTLLLGG